MTKTSDLGRQTPEDGDARGNRYGQPIESVGTIAAMVAITAAIAVVLAPIASATLV